MVKPPWYGQNDGNFKILLAFSGLQHALASKPGYNFRVSECQEAATILLRYIGDLIQLQSLDQKLSLVFMITHL